MEEREEGIFFTLEEALSFDRGQEIDEMLAISLDPDITLQMYEKYVHIRGIVLLQGEYRKYKNRHETPSDHRNDETYMEKVIDKNQLEARFSHRFPLDISVPNERIEDINNIEVSIDAFDYELPDVQTLKIQASLHIHGVKNNETAAIEDEEEEVQADVTTSENMEALKEPNKEEQTNHVKKDEIVQQSAQAEHHEQNSASEVQDGDATKEEKATIHEETSERKTVQEDDVKSTKDENITADVMEMEEPISQHAEEQAKEMAIQLSEAEESGEETIQDIKFLTELFEANEEETKTTIKIYIIQEEDTIESIAKKYNVPTLELMKNNQLTDGDLSEGQLIQIPITK